MTESTKTKPDTLPDWDAIYREGVPPWETGLPSGELTRVLEEGIVSPGTALEVGCGTGADSIYLAQRGFEVTGVDSSPMAIERARARSRLKNAAVCFVLNDAFEFVEKAKPFDFIYDAGFYHFARQTNLNRYLDLLWRTTRPGSYYLTLVGSTGEAADGGPPQVSEEELRSELGRLLEFVHVRHFRFESPACKKGYLGWSCLLKRPFVAR